MAGIVSNASASVMDGRFPYYYAPGSFPMNYPYYQHPAPGPSRANSPAVGPTAAHDSSTRSSSPSSIEMDGHTLEETTVAPQKKHYDKWSHEDQKTLVSLWADHHARLESKDARKVWDEIAREINRILGTKRTGDKCKTKMKYLIDKYKEAKDWNCKQSGGNRRQSVFYEEIDAVLGCRDGVTLQNVAEAGSSAGSSPSARETNVALAGQETSPQARTERKKKRKRARVEEQDDEERELLRSSLSGLEKQRKDMNSFMDNFARVQEQQANTMNALVGALTNFLQNSKS